MFIRPYTVSQVAMLLLTLFLLIYLTAAIKRAPHKDHTHTRWMLQVIGWGALNVGVTMIIGLSENPFIDLLVYTRYTWGMLFWYAMARAIYILPPFASITRREERIVSWVMVGVMGVEIPYLLVRLLHSLQIGIVEVRPPLADAPLLLGGVWVVMLIGRKLWEAEEPPGRSIRRHLYAALVQPCTDIGRFHRGFLLVVFNLLLMSISFIFTTLLFNLTADNAPLWLLIANDLLVTGAILFALFAYLSSPLAPSGLEIRVIGAGLTIFLSLISVLGWIITLTFLKQQAVGIHPSWIFGSQMQSQLFATPEIYRPLAGMLSDLLAPLLWFALAGTLFFVIAYTTYYRSTLQATLSHIINGFQQVQQGNLSHRIPNITWQDEFSQIGISFNQMTASLEQANRELQTYHQHLQDLVEQRTAELRREMELRRRLELHQGIQEERARIARETHDGLLQTLLGVRIRLNRGKRLSQLETSQIEAELHELAGEITQAAQDLRSLINELNEKILPEGLIPALQQVVERQQRAYPIAIQTHFDYQTGLLSMNQELNMMRIVQEALTNAVRHGEASLAWVSVTCECAAGSVVSVRVQIEDNGSGFDPNQAQSSGWGLKNMQRRAEQMGATLTIHGQAGAGTIIDLQIPIPY
ncbi:MAG: sensor histidine kinase, partial [Caldilineaceae bacterium]|nr:sensor histidine kinase [Caldilineaceae bacterium]